jgi:hypothetical protein
MLPFLFIACIIRTNYTVRITPAERSMPDSNKTVSTRGNELGDFHLRRWRASLEERRGRIWSASWCDEDSEAERVDTAIEKVGVHPA